MIPGSGLTLWRGRALREVTHVDLKAGELKFYRPKVDKEQTYHLIGETRWWADCCAPAGRMAA